MGCFSKKTKAKLQILFNFVGVCLYLFDFSTDSYSAYRHRLNNDLVWFWLTVSSIITPMILSSIGLIFYCFGRLGALFGCLLMPLVMCCTPIVPLGILIWSFVDSIKHYPDNDVEIAGDLAFYTSSSLKLVEAATESFPQAALQMYIVIHLINQGIAPELWQWITISASLLSLAYSIASNDLFTAIGFPGVAKAGLFVLVLLFAASRIFVSCLFSIIHKGLFFMPMGVEVGLFILFMVTNSYFCKSKGVCLFSFILASSSNLAFAIGGYFLPVLPIFHPITLATLIIAAICCPAYIIIGSIVYHKSKG